jgi:hypothetical protein
MVPFSNIERHAKSAKQRQKRQSEQQTALKTQTEKPNFHTEKILLHSY